MIWVSPKLDRILGMISGILYFGIYVVGFYKATAFMDSDTYSSINSGYCGFIRNKITYYITSIRGDVII